MKDSISYTTKSHIFQELFCLFGKLVHSDLVRQIEYLKAENKVLRNRLPKRLILNPFERTEILKYGQPLGSTLKNVISIVSYQTFVLWAHKKNSEKPSSSKTIRGRPRTKNEIRELIIRLAKENSWGYTRILGELKKLGIESVSRNTIKNILKEYGLEPAPKRGYDTWDNFIKRHFQTLWACDFFTKTVWTLAGPKTFNMLFFINVHTRKVQLCGFTTKPTREWVCKQTKDIAFVFQDTDSTGEKLLIRDGDSKYSKEFDEILGSYGVKVKRIPYKSPNLNPYAEGWVGTIKRECLDHFFVFGEKHLRYLVNKYVGYYNTKRPHSGLNNMPIKYESKETDKRRLRCKSDLGGMIKHYYWG